MPTTRTTATAKINTTGVLIFVILIFIQSFFSFSTVTICTVTSGFSGLLAPVDRLQTLPKNVILVKLFCKNVVDSVAGLEVGAWKMA